MTEDVAAVPADAEIDASRMPLLAHLVELRSRLLKSLLTIGIAFAVCFYFSRTILIFLVQPLVKAGQKTLIYTQPTEAFFVEMKVALFAALMIAFPVIANQLWKFVAPGLYKQEKRALLPFLLATPILFIMGAATAYYGAIPVALKFLLGFGGDLDGVKLEALPASAYYLSFIMQFIMAFGIAFLMPILLMLLERAGIVTRAKLISLRRYMIVAAFAIAAVATPPDILSQFMLAVPLILLYEISLLAIWFTQRRRARVDDAADQPAV